MQLVGLIVIVVRIVAYGYLLMVVEGIVCRIPGSERWRWLWHEFKINVGKIGVVASSLSIKDCRV